MPMNPFAAVFFFATACSFAQGLTFGFVGGVPLTVLLNPDSSTPALATPLGSPPWMLATNVTDRYIVGPSVGWRFHGGFALEAEAIYRHLYYENSVPSGMGYYAPYGGYDLPVSGDAQVSVGDWEFPVQVKYRLPKGSLQSVFPGADVRPYISAGAAFDTLRISDTYSVEYQYCSSPDQIHVRCGYIGPGGTNANFAFGLQHKNVFGPVAGVGLDVRWGRVHILPEFRYTRWTRLHFDADFENSARDQFEFLIGISR